MTRLFSVPLVLVTALLAACAGSNAGPGPNVQRLEGVQPPLGQIYTSGIYQLTGVAVSRRGRVFVNFPRWDGPYRMAVGEVLPDGRLVPYPDERWNAFDVDPRQPPAGDRFVCVQSVHIDDRDRLWILDPAAPRLAGVVRGRGGGPKLIEIDLATDQVARVIRFDESIAPENSYLNDVRIELGRRGSRESDMAFITDSGAGAIIAVDLSTGRARRFLSDHPSTKADPSLVPVIGDREFRAPDGSIPQIHADGIAIDQSRGILYWQALTGKRLYALPTALLRDFSRPEADIAAAVRDLGETVVADGLACDRHGVLYFTALERDGIVVRLPDGSLQTLVSDPHIAWPDSIALAWGRMPDAKRPEDLVVFTTSQIHRTPRFNGTGEPPPEPYRILVAPAPRRVKAGS